MPAPTRTVAVLGASGDRRKFGNKAVRAYRAAGWQVFPIHPTETSVEGLPAFASLAAVPLPLDTISVYVPASIGLRLLPEMVAAQPRAIWLNPGAESAALLAAARDLHLPITCACSIVSLGHSPVEFPDS